MIWMIKEKTLVTIKEDIQIEYLFSDDLPMIFLGEITNMPGHGIFIGKSGKSSFGYPVDNFRELGEEEI